MGLEFDHPQGAKLVMRRLYEHGVWAIFSTLDPRCCSSSRDPLTPDLVDEVLDRTGSRSGARSQTLRGGRQRSMTEARASQDASGARAGRPPRSRLSTATDAAAWSRRSPRRHAKCRKVRE
jgi:hypothetical protein